YQKISSEIVINKLVKNHNHSLALYRKKFAPSLHSFSQEELDGIKFLTQECKLGTKAQHQAIQTKLEREVQYQQLSEYKNSLPTQELSSIQSVFFEPVQNKIKKYLTLDSPQFKLPATHEYTNRYLEDKYDALQASLKNLLNMVNHEDILETWKVSLFDHYSHSYPYYVILLRDNTHLYTCLYIISNGFYCRHFFSIFKMSHNMKFDVKLISNRWYTDLMQVSDYSIIEGMAIEEINSNEQINQLISICGPNTYQASIHTSITQKQEYAYSFGVAKSELKFALDNRLVDEFAELIEKFIENHTDANVNNQIMIEVTRIENPKKLKYKECPKILKSTPIVQNLNAKNLNKKQNLNTKQSLSSQGDKSDKLRQIIETDTEVKEEFEKRSKK
ncbi:35076_t:CDS:2, partial [Gigaspora margarita]